MNVLTKGLSSLYTLFILATLGWWINNIVQDGQDPAFYAIIWAPAAAALIPLLVFRKHAPASLCMNIANWSSAIFLWFLYFPADGSTQNSPEGQYGMGNFVLMIMHWGFLVVAFVVSLLIFLFAKPKSQPLP